MGQRHLFHNSRYTRSSWMCGQLCMQARYIETINADPFYSEKESRTPPFVAFICSVEVATALLLLASDRATEIGAASMDNEVVNFLQDPQSERFQTEPQERTLAQDVLIRRCEHARESFIPTFRRIDYLFTCSDRQKYRMVLSKPSIGKPIVSFRMVIS